MARQQRGTPFVHLCVQLGSRLRINRLFSSGYYGSLRMRVLVCVCVYVYVRACVYRVDVVSPRSSRETRKMAKNGKRVVESIMVARGEKKKET